MMKRTGAIFARLWTPRDADRATSIASFWMENSIDRLLLKHQLNPPFPV